MRYRDAAGNLSTCLSKSIIHDNQAPSAPSLGLGEGAAATNSLTTLIRASATDATDVYLTNTPACANGGAWEALVPAKPWVLTTSNGNASVYAKLRDLAGNESVCISSSITHDDQAPTGGTAWALTTFLKPAVAVHGNEWGKTLAISGTTVAVGVMYEDSNQTTITNGYTASSNASATSAGAVYIYRK